MEKINASIGFDRRLYAQDIAGSVAHCDMLVAQGILTAKDGRAIKRGLAKVRERDRSRQLQVLDQARGHPFQRRGAADRADRPGRRAPAHGALAQRPGRARCPAVGARHHRPARADAARPAGRPDRSRRRICRDHHAGLHPSADGAADHLRPSPAGLCRDVRPRPQPLRRLPRAAERIAAGCGGAGRLAASRSIRARRPRRWASTGRWPIRSMPCRTATMSSSSSPRPRSRPCTCRACRRRS